jgi:hypothetical protein
MSEEYRPRFLFEITEEQKVRADKLISHYGIRKAIFSPILDEVLDMIEKHGGMAIGLFLSDGVRPSDLLPSLARVKELEDGQS